MKPAINIGAYGWRHQHWSPAFYPDDLPEDWQLMFYSNEFNVVMVPATYWVEGVDCEQWLGSVHEKFRFWVQCEAEMFNTLSAAEITRQLKILSPQLVSLVFDGDERVLPPAVKSQMISMAESLNVPLLGINLTAGGEAVWQSGETSRSPHLRLACIRNELIDLRGVREVFEQFALQLGVPHSQAGNIAEACIIVQHPQLQADNIRRARTVLEVMGY